MHVIAFAAVRVVFTKFFGIHDVHALMMACVSGGVILPFLAYRFINRLGWNFLFTLEKKEKPQQELFTKKKRKPEPLYES